MTERLRGRTMRLRPHPRPSTGALAGAPGYGGAKLALRETPPSPPAHGGGEICARLWPRG
jgi:hypothetical protein